MKKAGELAVVAEADRSVALASGGASLEFSLPRQAVSLLVLDWQ
jgi:hypothetical protein